MAPPPPPPIADIDKLIDDLWSESTEQIVSIEPATENWKAQALPLARIKKIMKSEECILADLEKDKAASGGEPSSSSANTPQRFMIAGEAPVLIGKACELLIRELTMRAWRHTERNRRRTLQRQDVHAAVGESEVFDFLIDIVPRVSQASAATAKYGNPDQQNIDNSGAEAAPLPAAANASAVGGGDEGGMSLADAELRLAQLEQMQQQYLLMQQHMQQADAAGAASLPGPGPGVQAPMPMNPFGYQNQEQAAQWAAMLTQQQPPNFGGDVGAPGDGAS